MRISFWKRGRSLVCILVALQLMGVTAVAGAGEKPAPKGPVLVTPQPTFEAGQVVEGEEVTHTFIIQNKGNQSLLIKSVKPG